MKPTLSNQHFSQREWITGLDFPILVVPVSGNGLTELCWGITQTGHSISQVTPINIVQEYDMGHFLTNLMTLSGTMHCAGM